MTEQDMVTELKAFVVSEFLDGRAAGFDENTPLLEWGILDSISAAMMTAFVREKFGIEVPKSEVVPENLETLAAFTGLLRRLQASAPQ